MKINVEKLTIAASKAEQKALTQPLYVKGTCKEYKGNIHILKCGKIFSGLKHTQNSKRLIFRKTK